MSRAQLMAMVRSKEDELDEDEKEWLKWLKTVGSSLKDPKKVKGHLIALLEKLLKKQATNLDSYKGYKGKLEVQLLSAQNLPKYIVPPKTVGVNLTRQSSSIGGETDSSTEAKKERILIAEVVFNNTESENTFQNRKLVDNKEIEKLTTNKQGMFELKLGGVQGVTLSKKALKNGAHNADKETEPVPLRVTVQIEEDQLDVPAARAVLLKLNSEQLSFTPTKPKSGLPFFGTDKLKSSSKKPQKIKFEEPVKLEIKYKEKPEVSMRLAIHKYNESRGDWEEVLGTEEKPGCKVDEDKKIVSVYTKGFGTYAVFEVPKPAKIFLTFAVEEAKKEETPEEAEEEETRHRKMPLYDEKKHDDDNSGSIKAWKSKSIEGLSPTWPQNDSIFKFVGSRNELFVKVWDETRPPGAKLLGKVTINLRELPSDGIWSRAIRPLVPSDTKHEKLAQNARISLKILQLPEVSLLNEQANEREEAKKKKEKEEEEEKKKKTEALMKVAAEKNIILPKEMDKVQLDELLAHYQVPLDYSFKTDEQLKEIATGHDIFVPTTCTREQLLEMLEAYDKLEEKKKSDAEKSAADEKVKLDKEIATLEKALKGHAKDAGVPKDSSKEQLMDLVAQSGTPIPFSFMTDDQLKAIATGNKILLPSTISREQLEQVLADRGIKEPLPLPKPADAPASGADGAPETMSREQLIAIAQQAQALTASLKAAGVA